MVDFTGLGLSLGSGLLGSMKGGSTPSVGANGDQMIQFTKGQGTLGAVGADNGADPGVFTGYGNQVVQNVQGALQKLNAAGINPGTLQDGQLAVGYNKAKGGYF